MIIDTSALLAMLRDEPEARVCVHTTNDDVPIATVWRDGIAVTLPAGSIVDAANQLQPEQLEMAVRQALARALLTRRQLEQEAVLRKGIESSMEHLLRCLHDLRNRSNLLLRRDRQCHWPKTASQQRSASPPAN